MSRRVLPPLEELDALRDQETEALALALRRAVAEAWREGPGGPAERHLGRELAQVLTTSDVLGRRRVLLEARGQGALQFAAVPRVPLRGAIEAILDREPMLAQGYEAVQRLWEQRAFALAAATTQRAVEDVQRLFGRFLERGVTPRSAEQRILRALREDGEEAGATRAYAETVYRTVSASAYADGRMEQARDPAIREAYPALRFVATRDADVRPNHLAADGFVAATDDPVWEKLRQPLGYQCRCTTELVGARQAKRAGVLSREGVVRFRAAPRGAGPDPGFRVGI